jgi:hypothetical protein
LSPVKYSIILFKLKANIMTNKHVIKHLLQPVNPADNARWREFLQSVRDDIMWKPNFDGFLSGLDRNFGNFGGELKEPSAQIWTSTLPKPEVNILLEEGSLQHYFDRDIYLLEHFELKPRNWNYASRAEYQFMTGREKLLTAKTLEDETYIAELRQAQNQHILAVQQQGGIAGHLKPKSVDQMFATLAELKWMNLTGKIYYCRIRHEGFGDVAERHVIFAFIQDTVFMKVFILEGGLKIGMIV